MIAKPVLPMTSRIAAIEIGGKASCDGMVQTWVVVRPCLLCTVRGCVFALYHCQITDKERAASYNSKRHKSANFWCCFHCSCVCVCTVTYTVLTVVTGCVTGLGLVHCVSACTHQFKFSSSSFVRPPDGLLKHRSPKQRQRGG